LSEYLTASLGVAWEPVSRRHSIAPKYEIAGVPAALREEFSQRGKEIEAMADALGRAFAASNGRRPTTREMLQLRQQATLTTRPPKQHHSLAKLTGDWRTRTARLLDPDPVAWVSTLKKRNDLPLLRAADLDDAILRDAGRVAVHAVGEKRATFTRANVLAEALRQLHGVRFVTPDERAAVADRTATLALDAVVRNTPPELTYTPERHRHSDGSSRFRPTGHDLYTTRDLLDAEARLLDAGRSLAAPAIAAAAISPLVEQTAPGRPVALSEDQSAAIAQIVSSGRVVDVLVGPAGTGKSTTMGALRAVWEQAFGDGSVIGLAPSATAAEVLGVELGIGIENTAKWLSEAAQQSTRMAMLDRLHARYHRRRDLVGRRRLQARIEQLTAEIERWSVRANQLIILDEASLAGTYTLDALASHARDVGAKLLLVGDWAQLSAVTAGGAFHMLVRDRADAAELNEVRRFREAWERPASIGLRLGRPDVLTEYADHGRIDGADRSAIETIRTQWNEATSIAQVWAEYETIDSTAHEDRYVELFAAAGLTDVIAGSASYGPLLAALRSAESRGLDVVAAFRGLVGQRGLDDAEDVASVLHHRVDRWVAASGTRPSSTERIVGLFRQAVGVTDVDTRRGLEERRALIEQRARHLVLTAIERRQPWAAQLGAPPDDAASREAWLRQLDTVAAYRDRWNVQDRTVLGPSTTSVEQADQRQLAQRAAHRALAIHRSATGVASVGARAVSRDVEREVER